jgi:hypothetical protein
MEDSMFQAEFQGGPYWGQALNFFRIDIAAANSFLQSRQAILFQNDWERNSRDYIQL